MRTAILATVFSSAVLLSPAVSFGATTIDCGGGVQSHVATQAEADASPSKAIVAGVTQICPGDASLGISNLVGAAKQYLLSVPKKALSNCAPPTDPNNITRLNNTFAVCAANFLKAYQQKYGTIYITSAFRDGAAASAANGSGASANACAGGANGSNHMRGLAMDVYPSDGNFKQIWDFAIQNPQFGVCFPHEGQGGTLLDRPHMILAGIGGTEGGKCAALGVAKPCSGVPFNPNEVQVASGNPVTDLANIIRQAITPTQQQAAQAQQQAQQPAYSYPSIPTTQTNPSSSSSGAAATPTACTPSYFCSGSTYYYKNSSCENVEVQSCAYGCNGDSCALPPVSSQIDLSSGASGNANGSGTGATSTPATSTLDQILSYVNPTAIDIATATPVVLNPDLGNISSAVENAQQPTQTGPTLTSPDMSASQVPSAQETFTSQDLANAQPTVSPQNTFALNILENMKQSLLAALNYLHPFAGITQNQAYAE